MSPKCNTSCKLLILRRKITKCATQAPRRRSFAGISMIATLTRIFEGDTRIPLARLA